MELNQQGTIPLDTPRLFLRRFIFEDRAEIFHNCWADPEVWKWTCYAKMESLEDVMSKADMFTPGWLNAYQRNDRYNWAIELKENRQVIGRIFARHPDKEKKEIEITL
jgi:ribosomal-protein-alanine N-acetyltransferase